MFFIVVSYFAKHCTQNTVNSADEIEIWLSCMALNWGKESSLYHSKMHYSSNSKHHIALNINTLELYWFTCDFSLNKLREMIAEGRESEQIDNIINTAAVFISGKADNLASVKQNSEKTIQKKNEETTKAESPQENKPKVQISTDETDEQREARELNHAIFQSSVDSYYYDINEKEEKELYCIRGLNNLGNTCFFNSVLQWLNATKDLYFMLNDKNNGWYGAGYGFHNQVRKFMSVMRTKSHQAHAPTGMLNAIWRKYPRFHGGGQHDAHELLITLLDWMDTEAVKKQKRSIVDKSFGGTFLTSVLWLNWLNVSRTVQRFTDIILDLNFKSVSSTSSYVRNYNT